MQARNKSLPHIKFWNFLLTRKPPWQLDCCPKQVVSNSLCCMLGLDFLFLNGEQTGGGSLTASQQVAVC